MEPTAPSASRATVQLFVARIPAACAPTAVYPPERDAYIRSARDARLRSERYAVWRLLSYAVRRTYGIRMEEVTFAHDESGRWSCDACELSLSHTDGAVAVALSTYPVGVDIERMDATDACRMARVEQRFLTAAERTALDSLAGDERAQATLRLWTAKEARFKARRENAFRPATIDAANGVWGRAIKLSGENFFVSVATEPSAACDVDVFAVDEREIR